MRRLVAMFSCVTLVLALSASSALADPPQNSVTGGGQQAIGFPNFFSLSAHSDANGANPHGSFSFSGGPPGSQPWHVNVTCLLVAGNDAIATGVADRPATAAGQVVVAEAVDNGNPKNGQPVDLLRFSFANSGGIYPGPSPECFLPIFPPIPIQNGNIVVRQAAP